MHTNERQYKTHNVNTMDCCKNANVDPLSFSNINMQLKKTHKATTSIKSTTNTNQHFMHTEFKEITDLWFNDFQLNRFTSGNTGTGLLNNRC